MQTCLLGAFAFLIYYQTNSQLLPMILYIKNMVCPRCVLAVERVLNDNNIPFERVEIGAVHLLDIAPAHRVILENALAQIGLEIINERAQNICQQVKNILVDVLYKRKNHLIINLSEHLSNLLHLNYHYISYLFATVEKTTIEKYFIQQKIQYVQSLLLDSNLTISQIAWELNYSSVAHLSQQFKQHTGLTPSQFRKSLPPVPPQNSIKDSPNSINN